MKRDDIPKNFDEFVKCVGLWEGFRATPYTCPSGVLTIGYGRTHGVKEDEHTTPAKERIWLSAELSKLHERVENYIAGLTWYESLALTDFAYNCGMGNFRKLVDNRDMAIIRQKILAYNRAGGKVLQGLQERRRWEVDMMLQTIDNITGYRGCVIFKVIIRNKSQWVKYTGLHRRAEKCYMTDEVADCAIVETPDGHFIPIAERILTESPIQFMGIN